MTKKEYTSILERISKGEIFEYLTHNNGCTYYIGDDYKYKPDFKEIGVFITNVEINNTFLFKIKDIRSIRRNLHTPKTNRRIRKKYEELGLYYNY